MREWRRQGRFFGCGGNNGTAEDAMPVERHATPVETHFGAAMRIMSDCRIMPRPLTQPAVFMIRGLSGKRWLWRGGQRGHDIGEVPRLAPGRVTTASTVTPHLCSAIARWMLLK